MSLDDLTETQQTALEAYLNFTQESDVEIAVANLQAHGYDLEKAVSSYFDNQQYNEGSSSEQSATESSNLNQTNEHNGHNARTSNRDTSSYSFISVLTWPFSFVFNLLFKVFYLPSYLFNGYRRLEASRPSASISFKQQFIDAYGDNAPMFLDLEYPQAVEKAKRELKYLLVVLHSDEHDDTDEFCRKTLCSSTLLNFLRNKNILVWGGNVRYTEGYQVSVTLQVNTFPFLAIVAYKPRTGDSEGNTMVVLDRIEGMNEPDEVISRITRQMDRLDPELVVLRNERAEQELARQIRDQQDLAYQLSLKADQEKSKRLQQQREAQEREERIKKIQFETKALEARYRYLYRQQILAKVQNEPSANESNVSRFSIKLLDGKRVVRRFRADDTVMFIYEYVESLLPLEEDLPTTIASQIINQLPSDYQHKFKFRLFSTFPRCTFQPSDYALKDIKNLWPGASLMVETIEDEESVVDGDEIIVD